MDNQIIKWLLEGDPSVRYLVHRDLLNSDKKILDNLKKEMLNTGWVHDYLRLRNVNGHWGNSFYSPKWTSSHYTLLELKNLGALVTDEIKETIALILKENRGPDGGINPSRAITQSDVCINGMFLNYACYFDVSESSLVEVIDYIIIQQMADGGFNCRKNRSGASHSSLHSTISLLEGIYEYFKNGYTYRKKELEIIYDEAKEFILIHRLYKSDKTGKVISKGMTMLSYPPRWRYDILRCLYHFADAKVPYDVRMNDALEVVVNKKLKDGTWPVQAKHAGEVHFEMERTGKSSRMNTYRAMRVLKAYGKQFHNE
jgi:hypothetical protein